MKSVAESLYCWFLIRGLVDKKINLLKKFVIYRLQIN